MSLFDAEFHDFVAAGAYYEFVAVYGRGGFEVGAYCGSVHDVSALAFYQIDVTYAIEADDKELLFLVEESYGRRPGVTLQPGRPERLAGLPVEGHQLAVLIVSVQYAMIEDHIFAVAVARQRRGVKTSVEVFGIREFETTFL